MIRILFLLSHIKTSLIKLYEYIHKYRILKLVSSYGKDCKIKIGSRTIFLDNSQKSDISIGDNFTMYGTLYSQSGGKINIGSHTRLGRNSIIRCVNSVSVGDFTAIADNVIITDNNTHPEDPIFRRKMKLDKLGGELRLWKYSKNQSINIGSNVWVGENSRINRGVKIGDNSIVLPISHLPVVQ